MSRQQAKDTFFKFLGAAIMLFAIWGFFYQFTFWPWLEEWCWWYIPQLATAATISGYVIHLGDKISKY